MSRLSVGYRKYFPAPRIYRASARKYLKIPPTLVANRRDHRTEPFGERGDEKSTERRKRRRRKR